MLTSKLAFIDFEDSFSYNVISLVKSFAPIEILSFKEAHRALSQYERIIWGPGPGQALEYGVDLELLARSLENPNQKHLGICLGHQLIGLALGGYYAKEEFPLHGVSYSIDLPDWNDWGIQSRPMEVQAYNSLVIEFHKPPAFRVLRSPSQRICMMAGQQFLSFQFHPESVGTSCPNELFRNVMRNFL